LVLSAKKLGTKKGRPDDNTDDDPVEIFIFHKIYILRVVRNSVESKDFSLGTPEC
jgi:hypothetical protein